MASYQRLRDGGVVPAFALDHGLTVSLYYRDPDGNFVELRSDRFGGWTKSTEWMRTSGGFKANPTGTFCDPEQVFQAHSAGRPFSEFQPAIPAGRFLPEPIPAVGLPV